MNQKAATDKSEHIGLFDASLACSLIVTRELSQLKIDPWENGMDKSFLVWHYFPCYSWKVWFCIFRVILVGLVSIHIYACGPRSALVVVFWFGALGGVGRVNCYRSALSHMGHATELPCFFAIAHTHVRCSQKRVRFKTKKSRLENSVVSIQFEVLYSTISNPLIFSFCGIGQSQHEAWTSAWLDYWNGLCEMGCVGLPTPSQFDGYRIIDMSYFWTIVHMMVKQNMFLGHISHLHLQDCKTQSKHR